jgi:hypothetical protein
VWACDFLQTYDVWLRAVFAFFIVDINPFASESTSVFAGLISRGGSSSFVIDVSRRRSRPMNAA